MEKKEIDKLIKTFGSNGFFGASIVDRRDAANALICIADSSAVPALIKALKDNDNTLQSLAIKALTEIRDPCAVPDLIRALKDHNMIVRANAAVALGNIKDTSGTPALLETLRNNKHFTPAIEALVKIKDPRTFPVLITVLIDGIDNNGIPIGYYDRGNIDKFLNALGEIGDPKAIPTLIKVIKDNNSYNWENAGPNALNALGKIGGTDAVAFLIELLKDDDRKKRLETARILISLGMGSIAVPALIELFNGRYLEDRDNDIPYWAAGLLGGIGDSRAVPDLIKALEDGDRHKSVRCGAVEALAQIGNPSFVPILIKVLGDSDWIVRNTAVHALETMNDIRALKPLEYLMKNDSDENIRKTAYTASAKIRSSRGILEEEPTHKISAGGDIMIDSAKFSATFSDSSTKISDVGMVKGNVGGKKDMPFSNCPYCGAELTLPKTPKFCPYCGDQLRE